MFESSSAPHRPDVSTNDQLPDDWAVLATPVDGPGPAAWVEVARRDALVAVRGGGWEPAVVWHRSWTTEDRRTVWSVQVEYNGRTAWYLCEEDRIRLDPRRPGRRR